MGIGIGTIIGAIGTAVSTVGTISAAQQRAERAEANAKLARIQARRQRQRAQLQREIGQAEAERRERAGERQIGAARAAIGASGVQITGTAQEAVADVALEAELNEELARFESEIRAEELEQGAANSLTQANALEQRAQAAETAGFINAASTLLTGGAKVARRTGGSSPGSNQQSGFQGVQANVPGRQSTLGG